MECPAEESVSLACNNAATTVEEQPFRACPELAEGAALAVKKAMGFSPRCRPPK
jgi:hypothetical protein